MSDKYTEMAAQIWCQPGLTHKEMDVELATAVANALRELAAEKDREIVDLRQAVIDLNFEIVDLVASKDAETAALGKPLGEIVNKQMIVSMADEIATLKHTIEYLEHEISVIGDMAVSDWNEAVVAAVDALGRPVASTYGERRRIELEYARSLAMDVNVLTEKLGTSEPRIAALETELDREKDRRCMYNKMREENFAMARKQLEDNLELQAQIATLRQELAQSYEAIAHLHEGKPLGELVGRQMIELMAIEIVALKNKLADAELNSGEFICAKCGLRKNGEGPKGDF